MNPSQKKKSKSAGKKGSILVVAGETSGDLLAADVIRELGLLKYRNFFGTGGDRMLQEGVELIENIESMEIMGWLNALKSYRRLLKLAKKLTAMAQERKVRFALLTDYPGFNLKLAEMLRMASIPVFYLVSPQIWAWKYDRVHRIRKNVDLMLTLFPFEKEIYDAEGIPAECIGHPMVKRIPEDLIKQKPLHIAGRKPVIGLLPGSRASEIRNHLPPILQAASILHKKYPQAYFPLAVTGSSMQAFIQEQLALYPKLPVEPLPNRSLRIIQASDAILATSGTVTLEAAFLKTPMTIVYRAGLLNYLIGSAVTRTRFIGLPNLLARQQVARELLMSEVTPENMARETERILEDSAYRHEIQQELAFINRSMGRGDSARKAAAAMHKKLNSMHRGSRSGR